MPWPGCLQIFFSCRSLVSLVLTDGVHIVKEKSSIALNNFYNWILQVAWGADGASQKLTAPLWKNGSLLDHGERNKIDFVGPSRAKRPIMIYFRLFRNVSTPRQYWHRHHMIASVQELQSGSSHSYRLVAFILDCMMRQTHKWTFPSILKLFKTFLVHSQETILSHTRVSVCTNSCLASCSATSSLFFLVHFCFICRKILWHNVSSMHPIILMVSCKKSPLRSST